MQRLTEAPPPLPPRGAPRSLAAPPSAGDADTVVPPAASEALAAAFEGGVTVRHARGHVCARLPADGEAQLRAFLQAASSRANL